MAFDRTRPWDQGEIVFQYGPDLYQRTHNTHPVDVLTSGDRPTLRPHHVEASQFITAGRFSLIGKLAVLKARGDIWTLPAASGSPHNLAHSSGVAERDPVWSPDGRWIA
jgi:tricorn protease